MGIALFWVTVVGVFCLWLVHRALISYERFVDTLVTVEVKFDDDTFPEGST